MGFRGARRGRAGGRVPRVPAGRRAVAVQPAGPGAAGYPDVSGGARGVTAGRHRRCRGTPSPVTFGSPCPLPCQHSGDHSMAPVRNDYSLSQLDALEAESIHIIREVAAEFERPALLFSGGKDSIVMLALAEKAFSPAKVPFPVMHIDTGHNFPEVLEFRDRRVAEAGVCLVVGEVQKSIDEGR